MTHSKILRMDTSIKLLLHDDRMLHVMNIESVRCEGYILILQMFPLSFRV